jgi:hypothetical protein
VIGGERPLDRHEAVTKTPASSFSQRSIYGPQLTGEEGMETRLVGRRVRRLLAGAAAGLLTLAVLTAASTAAAADPAFTETEIEMVRPLTVYTNNPCTGEPVVIQGHLFLRLHLTVKDATHFTISEQTNTQGVGVNPITGVKHVTSDVDTFTATIQKSASATGHQTFLFSRSGESASADDFYLHLLIHFSWNAAGTVTAEFENFRADCR